MRRLLLFLVVPTLFAFTIAGDGDPGYPLHDSGVVDINYNGAPTACWNFNSTPGGTYPDDCSGSYTMKVNGSPKRVLDGTYPSGIDAVSTGYAWMFDGSTDCLSRADDDTFDFDGDFSVSFVVSRIDSSDGGILGKWDTDTPSKGWLIYYFAEGGLCFFTSSDGSSQSYIQMGLALELRERHFVTITYDYDTTTGTIYIDSRTPVSGSLPNPNNSSGDLGIGAIRAGVASSYHAGINLSNMVVYDGVVLTNNQHNEMFSRWQGRSSAMSVSSTSPPAARLAAGDSGVEPYIQQMPSNSWQVSGNGMEFPDAITNSIYRGCFVSGTTGWVETTGGSASIAADTTTKAFGAQSIKFTHTGAGDSSSVDSACKTDRIGSTVYVDVDAKDGGDTSSCAIQLLEYDAADCTTLLATNNIVAATDLAADWTHYEGTLAAGTWNGSTSSWRLRLACADTGGAYTVNWGYAQVSEQETWSVCCTDADADAVCNLVVGTINDPTSIGGTWEMSFTVRTPWVGDDGIAHQLMQLPGTAGNNNLISVSKTAADDFEFSVYTSAGAAKTASHAVNSTNWAADIDHDIILTHYHDGRIYCEIDGTSCSSSDTGAIQDDHSSSLYLNGTSSSSGNHAIRDLAIKPRGTLP